MNNKIYFWYDDNGRPEFRTEEPFRRRVIGLRFWTGAIAIAVATCSPKDQFNKKLGRHIVTSRLNSAISTLENNLGKDVMNPTACAFSSWRSFSRFLRTKKAATLLHGGISLDYVRKLRDHANKT